MDLWAEAALCLKDVVFLPCCTSADTRCFRTDRDLAREAGTKYQEAKRQPPKVYTQDELARIYALYEHETVRGKEPRYWEDVTVGTALPTLVKGPMTITGFIAYAQGWGGLYIRAHKLAYQMIRRHPGLGIPNTYGIPDCPERVHWEPAFAQKVGAPGAYDYGPERCSWLSHAMTNWIGDDGMLHKLACEIRRHNPEGGHAVYSRQCHQQIRQPRQTLRGMCAGGGKPGWCLVCPLYGGGPVAQQNRMTDHAVRATPWPAL